MRSPRKTARGALACLAMLMCVGAHHAAAGATVSSPLSPGRLSSNFRVRTVGGPTSERLEREVVQVLEAWHRRYLVAFESQPAGPIPVLLHPRRTFHSDTGAPHWADGAYTAEGTIHAAIGGVARVEPDLERRLAHELAHAFISHLSGGQAPRWLQEGLAQALSDPRPLPVPAAHALPAAEVEALDYAGTLAFTRALLESHGAAALRDALAGMGGGSSVESAFREHLGGDVARLYTAWRLDGDPAVRRQAREELP